MAIVCPTCHGDGTVTVNPAHPDPRGVIDVRCDACGGTGKVAPDVALRAALDEASVLMDGEAMEAACVLYDAVRAHLGLPADHLEREQARA